MDDIATKGSMMECLTCGHEWELEIEEVEEESNEGVYWTHEDMVKIIKAIRSYDYDSKRD